MKLRIILFIMCINFRPNFNEDLINSVLLLKSDKNFN